MDYLDTYQHINTGNFQGSNEKESDIDILIQTNSQLQQSNTKAEAMNPNTFISSKKIQKIKLDHINFSDSYAGSIVTKSNQKQINDATDDKDTVKNIGRI